MKTIQRYILLITFISGVSMMASAQSVFSISESMGSVRSIGMGGLGGAMDANAFSILDNASKVAFSRRTMEFGVQYSPWNKQQTVGTDRDNMLLDFSGYVSLASAHKLLFGVNYYAPGGNDMFQTDENGDRIGNGRLKPGYVSAGLGYAARIGEHCGLSAVVNYANWNPGIGPKTSALSIDMAVTHRINMEKDSFFDASLCASGWGGAFSEYEEDKLPGLLTVNGLYNHSFNKDHVLRAAADFGARCLDVPAFIASAGMEYIFKEMFYLRGGYHYISHESQLDSYGALGLGIRLFNTGQVDFSYMIAGDESPLKNTFMFGFNLLF